MVGAGQGMMIYFLPTPYLALALVAWAVATRHLKDGARRGALVAAVFLACAPFDIIRTAGIKGGAGGEFHWRWTPTPDGRRRLTWGTCRDCQGNTSGRQRQRDARSGSRTSSRRGDSTRFGRDGHTG